MGKHVQDVMTPRVDTVSPSQPLTEAARTMDVTNVGALPVVDGNRLVGMLTDRDIVVRAVAKGKDVNTVRVGDVASSDPVAVGPEDDLDEALALMARHRVRRLPVVQNGSLVGVLSQADVALEAKEKDTGELLQEISQPTSASRE
jgi:CBS domain-containing protein